METLKQLAVSQQLLANQTGGSCIGSLIWWSLNKNHINHQNLVTLAVTNDLPERYLPKEVKATTAFRRAWRYVAAHLSGNLLLRQITESTDGIVVGLVQEKADSQTEALDYDHLVTISFGKSTSLIGSNQKHLVVDDICRHYLHFLAHTTHDIRAMLLAFVEDTAISLRERGGVYFVPFPYHDQLNAMVATIEGIGDNSLYQLPLYDSPQTQHVLNTVTIATLDEELKKLDVELQNFMGDDKTRRSTMLKRLDVFDKLRARVSTFAGVLTFRADDLQEKVNKLQTELRTHLGLNEPTKLLDISADPTDPSTQLTQRAHGEPGSEEKNREGNKGSTNQEHLAQHNNKNSTNDKSFDEHSSVYNDEDSSDNNDGDNQNDNTNKEEEQEFEPEKQEGTTERTPAPKPWDDLQIEDDPSVDPFFTYDEEAGF